MTGLVKKISLLFFICFIVCLSSCSNRSATVKKNAEQMMQCIIDRDAEKLLTFFSKDMRENESEKTLEEIEALFEFIDGDIVSYTYSSSGGRKSVRDGEFDFYYRHPTFKRTETTTGKIYTIRFEYYYIWKEKPKQEGLCVITAFPGEDWADSDKGVTVGKDYELPSTWQ